MFICFCVVCKSSLELHNGHVSVFSEGIGRGSTFSITLPTVSNDVVLDFSSRSPVDMLEKAVSSFRSFRRDVRVYDSESFSNNTLIHPDNPTLFCPDSPALIEPVSNHRRETNKLLLNRVLIVDDVAMNRRMLRRVMNTMCGSIEEAGDGDEAVAKIKRSIADDVLFDAIAMDFQMPNMDGPTATKHIRELGYKGIILGVTGNGLPDDIASFIRQGANRVLLKPVNAATLAGAVEFELQHSKP